MEKKKFSGKEFALNFLKSQLAVQEAQLSSNTITDKQKEVVKSAIDRINASIEELDAMEEEVTDADLKQKVTDAVRDAFEAYADQQGGEGSENLFGKGKKGYLSTNQACHDFLNVIRKSECQDDFVANWKGKLSENGISGDWGMPIVVVDAIKDAWEKNTNVLNKFRKTGAKAMTIPINTSAQDEVNALGHKKGETKKEFDIKFATKKITSEFVYAMIMLNEKDVWEDDGDMLRYIVDTMMVIWKRTVLKAILVGDGLEDENPDKITSIEPVWSKKRTERGDDFVYVKKHVEGAQYGEEIMDMLDHLFDEDGESKLLFMKKRTLSQIRKYVMSATSTITFISKKDIEDMYGVEEIVTTSVLGTDVDIIAMMPEHYTTTGSLNPTMFSWREPKVNQIGYRLEIPIGGALDCYMSASVLLNKNAVVA